MAGEKGLEGLFWMGASPLVPQLEPLLLAVDIEELHAEISVLTTSTLD